MNQTSQPDLLARWYAAIRAGDVDALAAITTEDVAVRWNGPQGVVPWAGEWTGRERALTFFREVGAHLDVLSVETVFRQDTADAVVTVIEGHWRVKATGRDIRMRSANVFRLSGGRVAAYEVFPDSHAFVEALREG